MNDCINDWWMNDQMNEWLNESNDWKNHMIENESNGRMNE